MKDGDIGDNSEIDVDIGELEDFLSDLEDKQKAITEATGKLRATLKGILKDTGWHKGAFATIRKLAALSETERADFLRTFKPLFETMLEQGGWANEMNDLVDQIEGEQGD